ncbi:MAG: hypothetical protein Q7S60_02045 [bacterium]|nr:hypothetical protein [bacterium]
MLHNLFGWGGAILILLAYFLVSTKKILPTSFVYHILNLLGALGVIINTFAQEAFSAMILNVFWAFIAIYGLFRGIKREV